MNGYSSKGDENVVKKKTDKTALNEAVASVHRLEAEVKKLREEVRTREDEDPRRGTRRDDRRFGSSRTNGSVLDPEWQRANLLYWGGK